MSETIVRFCIRCGAEVSLREKFGASRPVCPSCGWIYFADPKVAAVGLIDQGSRVLLVRRINEPQKGLWSLPAGFVDAGEDPARAAERECLEETGLIVHAVKLVDVIAGREHERGADIVIVYQMEILGGTLQAGDDADAAAFFDRSGLPPMAFPSTHKVVTQNPG